MKKALLYLLLIISIAACSKDDNPYTTPTPSPTPQPTKTELIAAKPWKYFAWTVNPGLKDSVGNTYTDYLASLAPCMRDDIFTFFANTNITVDQGLTKCNQSDPQSTSGIWLFKNNETSILMNGVTYSVAKLTADSMRWNFTDVQGANTHTHTITFVH